MSTGLILLFFLAVLVAFSWSRVRRRLGMRVTGGTFAWTIAGFVVLVLALWAFARK